MKTTEFRTERFEANIGVVPGYFQDLPADADIMPKVIKLWNESAEEFFKKGGIYVSATFHHVKTVYREEWGCPKGGEDTVLITGIRNPKFIQFALAWKLCVQAVVASVGKKLEQETVHLAFQDTEFIYLTKDENEVNQNPGSGN